MSAIVRHAIEINVVSDDTSASATDIKPDPIACKTKAYIQISRKSAEKGARPRLLIAVMKGCLCVSECARDRAKISRELY
jgi:hypothetical protein